MFYSFVLHLFASDIDGDSSHMVRTDEVLIYFGIVGDLEKLGELIFRAIGEILLCSLFLNSYSCLYDNN